MKRALLLVIASALALGATASAQFEVPGVTVQPATPPAREPAANGAPGAESAEARPQAGGTPAFSLPMFDPASDTITWDGRVWKIDNNRLFRARFEKYLNTPETEIESQQAYDAVLAQIMDLLAPARVNPRRLDQAFRLLPQAAEFAEDAGLCDAIANQVLGAWLAQKQVRHLSAANAALDEERRRLEWNQRLTAEGSPLDAAPRNAAAAAEWAKNQEAKRAARIQPYTQRLGEVNALLNVNKAKSELSALQAKVEFQALAVQLFLQRRFRHVLVATRFYRSIFGDGDNQLRLGDETKSLFARVSGMPPTMTTLDALSNEVIRDVREGVDSVKFLLTKDELESASTRLGETFAVGEHLPEVRQFPRESRQQVLVFTRMANQLASALEVKDYTRAEQLVGELRATASDFDPTKPMTAIQTARNIAGMHIAKARNAALSGDAATLETELRAATEIWPNNPALADVSGRIFEQTDVQQQALNELDRLLAQGDHRAIFNDRARFIAAAALQPGRQAQLEGVLEEMTRIEAALQRAQEMELRGDPIGAWESLEKAATEFPRDNEMNRRRAELSGRAAEFVNALRRGEELEKQGQLGAGMAWYLDAHKRYPPSELAQERIQALAARMLPGAQ